MRNFFIIKNSYIRTYKKYWISWFNNAYAILILTEWENFRKLNCKEIAKKMVRPALIFESRSITNPYEVRDAGLSLLRLGDGLGD